MTWVNVGPTHTWHAHALSPTAFRSLIRTVRHALHDPCQPIAPLCHPPCVPSNGNALLGGAIAEIRHLRAEISGLLSQLALAGAHPIHRTCPTTRSPSLDRLPAPDAMSAIHARRSYAVAAVGEIPLNAGGISHIEKAIVIHRVPMITNLGTMMDVLI